MNMQIKDTIGKPIFIERFPMLFALIVFLGTELVLYATGLNDNLNSFNDNPLRGIAVLTLKFCVFLALAYGYTYFKQQKRAKG